LSSRPFFHNPAAPYEAADEKVKALGQRLSAAIDHQIALRKENLASFSGRLKALNPEGVLKRGYSITQDAAGKIIVSVNDLQVGEEVKTKFKDGIMHSKVVRKE
jgi:exodeoxyribonuclease VII large subunit